MTEVPLNHPDDEALRALSLGQLTEAELAQISAHLGDCPTCCRRIDQLATDDPLLACFQKGAASREQALVGPAQRRAGVRALGQLQEARSAARKEGREAVLWIPPAPGQVGDHDIWAEGEGNPTEREDLARRSLDAGLSLDLRKPTAPRSSSDTMPQNSEAGDRYQLLGEIARGGMGAVLRGRDRDLDRDLAVKVLLDKHANRPEVAQRFIREAQIGGRLQHPGVVPVYDIGRFGDRPFFTMKLVEGQTLAAILGHREQPTDEQPRLLNIALQVAQALAYAHAKGVIHRDLKPANVMVGAFGEVQVMDWGLAKVLAEGDGADEERVGLQLQHGEQTTTHAARGSGSTGNFSAETKAGSILGTLAYMPPEQANGDVALLDRRADVFGLGAILCEILTGKPPYEGRSGEEVQRKAANGDLANAHARLNGCEAHPELIALTKRCLSPAAADRPRDAQQVADGLSQYLNGVQERLQAAERERAVSVVRAGEERKRRKVQLALAAALVGLLVGGGAFAFWRHERHVRNAEAVAGLLGQCAEALRTKDAARAVVALEAAKKRSAEGGAQEQAQRLAGLDADLAVVRELDAVDQYLWTAVESKLPDPAVVAMKTREALRRFGADPDAASVDEAAARVSASVARDRVVAALDRLWLLQKSAGVRTLLRRVDADPYRDAVRDAVLAADGAKLVELAGSKAALEQPPGFVAFLGVYRDIPVERRRQLLQAAVGRSPGDLNLLMTLGITYSVNGVVADEGRWWFQVAVAAAPANAAAHLNLGNALYHQGQVDKAIACLQKGVALAPNVAAAHNNLGNALAGKGQVNAAIASYRQAIALDPKNASAYTNLGNARRTRREVEEAIACHRQAIALDPNLARAHYNLGVTLYGQRKVDEAIPCYRQAIRLEPDNAPALSSLGAALNDKGQVDKAIIHLQKAIALDPKLAMAHTNLGFALAAKGKLNEAIACHSQAIVLDPSLAMAHNNLGVALYGQGKLDQAIACYRQAVALDPKLAKAQDNLGSALRDKRQVEEAIACYQKAIALDPSFAMAHNNLGAILCEEKQDYDGAIAYFHKAIALDPSLAMAHTSLGNALCFKGQVEEAIPCYQKAVALNSEDAQARALLARSKRLVANRDKFAAFEKGTYTPATPAERLDLVEWCHIKKLHHTAASLYAAAFAADPKLAADLSTGHRYNAACSAALAATGQGEDAAKLIDKERTRLRRQALDWLRADLGLWARLFADGKVGGSSLAPILKHWQQDTDLAGLRGATALAKIPAEEQEAWTQLWADVAALLKKAEAPANKEST
jgi:tetratricopeptide (TPR) repeat protein